MLEDLETSNLDCYWVGSLDFTFWEIEGFSTKLTKCFFFFAGGRSSNQETPTSIETYRQASAVARTPLEVSTRFGSGFMSLPFA